MKRRTKIATLATTLLVGVTTLSIGFASWVISNQTSNEVTGNVTAEAVTNKSITITNPEVSGNIHFGAPEVQNIDSAWLTNDGDVTESLSATVTFSVSGYVGDLTVDFASGTEWNSEANSYSYNQDGLYNAIAANYITQPTFAVSTSGTSGAFTLDGTTGAIGTAGTDTLTLTRVGTEELNQLTVNLTITFAWGSAFNGNNPYNYFNGMSYADGHEDAAEMLQALYEFVDGLNYHLTIYGNSQRN